MSKNYLLLYIIPLKPQRTEKKILHTNQDVIFVLAPKTHSGINYQLLTLSYIVHIKTIKKTHIGLKRYGYLLRNDNILLKTQNSNYSVSPISSIYNQAQTNTCYYLYQYKTNTCISTLRQKNMTFILGGRDGRGCFHLNMKNTSV